MTIRRPEDVHAVFAHSFNNGDVDGLVAMYEPGAVLVNRRGETARGTAEIRQAYRGYLAAHPRIRVETASVFQCDNGLALTHGRWMMTGTGPDGTAVQMEGRSAEVLRRQPDGSWLVVIDNPFTPE